MLQLPNRLSDETLKEFGIKRAESLEQGFRGRIAARLDEYKFICQMISGVEKEGWYKRRIAHLQEMYDANKPQEKAEP